MVGSNYLLKLALAGDSYQLLNSILDKIAKMTKVNQVNLKIYATRESAQLDLIPFIYPASVGAPVSVWGLTGLAGLAQLPFKEEDEVSSIFIVKLKYLTHQVRKLITDIDSQEF